MIQTILVPLDGSPLAESILPAVQRIAHLSGAALRLVHVAEPPHGQPAAAAAHEQEIRQYLDAVAQRLTAAGLSVTIEVLAGDPAESIIQAGQGVELIAMGTHGRSGIGRWVYGSVADKVLRGASAPVLLVRARAEGPVPGESPRAIVVPLDGSELAEHALPLASMLGQEASVPLVLVQSIYWSELGVAGGFPDGYGTLMSAEIAIEAAEAGAKEYLAEIVAKLAAQGVTAQPIISLVPATDAILDAVDQHGAGLIVMTTHGRGGLGRFVYGSVADRVLRAASVPVLLVRAGVPLDRAVAAPTPSS
ncbi:MAG: universal stress protein [Chloroflexi bacterium]|nr:universal stress protein [Chloroflexota bacterium]